MKVSASPKIVTVAISVPENDQLTSASVRAAVEFPVGKSHDWAAAIGAFTKQIKASNGMASNVRHCVHIGNELFMARPDFSIP